MIGHSAWPPPGDVVPDALADIQGYAVTTRCSQPADSAPYTELMIGLGLQGDDEGGWQGIEVAYTVAGHHRVLVLDHDLFICGPAVAAQCAVPGSSDGP